MKFYAGSIVVTLSLAVATAGVVASPPPPAAPTSAPTATAQPALSKYQRMRLRQFQSSAPADEYFGRLKLSYLGIDNTFRDGAISSGDHTTDAGIATKVELGDDALRAWAARYPNDPQLARSYFFAIAALKKIWRRPDQERAWIYMNRIVAQFPDSYFAKIVKQDLAIGYTEHYFATPDICATPQPTLAPTPEPTDSPSPVPTPRRHGRHGVAPSPSPAPAAPAPLPSPTPSPSPTPQGTTAATGLSIEVLPSACVPPATPSPSPSPSPAAGASASPLPSPIAS